MGKNGENVEEQPLMVPETKKHITASRLIIMTYFWTCGGPFGIEAAVGAGGAFLTFMAILIVCILWALPQALMAAELSLMMEVNGGNVIWVQRAFGDFIGFVNAVDGLVMNLSSQALLVVLFVQYIPIDLPWDIQWALRAGFCVLTTLINIWGVQWLSRMSALLMVLIFSPFIGQFIMVVVEKTPIDFSALIHIPPLHKVHWGILISTAVWSFGGFDSIGFVAGEVKGGKKTFLLGVMGAFPLVTFNYFFPIMIDFIIDPNRDHWVAGYFGAVVYKYFPYWLGIWVTVASAISNFGQCSSGVATVARQIWAMAKGREEGVAQHRFLPHSLSISWTRHTGTVRPIVAIVFCNAAMLAISALPFNFLVQLYLLLRILNLLLEYFALIRLRFTEPNTRRPFEVPGGVIGCVVCTIPTIGISILAISTQDVEVIITGAVTIAAIFLLYPVKLLWIKVSHHFGWNCSLAAALVDVQCCPSKEEPPQLKVNS